MKKIITLVFALFLCLSVYAQSSDVISEILEAEEVSFGQVCYLSAVQMKFIDENASYENAIDALLENKIIPEKVDSDSIIPAINTVYILSRLWPVKGGLMFRLTKGAPRYAFKQFQSDGIIDSDLDPAGSLSGAQVLSIYTACLTQYGDFDMSTVSMEAE